MINLAAINIVSLIAIGMATAFYAVDKRSGSTRMFSLFLLSIGIGGWSNGNFIATNTLADLNHWHSLLVLPTVLAMVSGVEWIYRIRERIDSRGLNTSFGDKLLRFAQILGILYGLLGIIFWEWRVEFFLGALSGGKMGWVTPQFYLFFTPIAIALTISFGTAILVTRRQPERSEFLRLIAFIFASPMFVLSMLLPGHISAYAAAIGEIIILFGMVQYLVRRGQRGEFMKQFLSPEVAKLVNHKGLHNAFPEKLADITAVDCDIRGFTAYAEAQQSQQVIGLLKAYYRTIGEVAKSFDATIKDYAGDGVLILVGAPLEVAHHETVALNMATQIQLRTRPLLQQYGLDLGIGVASGKVTVGLVGDARMEYAAIGSAVNRASRLCQQARGGNILVDENSYQAAQLQPLSFNFSRPITLNLKGMERQKAWRLNIANEL